MFEVNDKVVYGIVGVCEVEDIAAPPIKGIEGDYYFLQPVYDDKGIIWPMSIAPYKVAIVLIDPKNDEQSKVANDLYNTLNSMGIDTILDDRNERPGVKFNDMDLIGIPVRITVGKKVNERKVELKKRAESESTDINVDNIIGEVKNIVNK